MSHGSAISGLGSLLLLLQPPTLVAQEKDEKPAVLRVKVPPAAELEIEGIKTKSAGESRLFQTPPLKVGNDYTYTLKLTWMAKDRRVVRMAVARMRAGEETFLDLRPDSKDDASSRIIFVPTPEKLVEQMLDLADIKKNDVVYDLGCGDGRIVILAAKKYGTRGVGVDIDPVRVKEARDAVKKAGVENLVTIRHGDALKVDDLEKATVVALYMLPEFQAKLRPILQKTLKPGSRVVSHDYDLPGWEPLKSVEVQGPRRQHVLYVWRIEELKNESSR